MSFDLRLNVLVLLLNDVNVAVQVVNIVDEGVVLFLRLAESRYDFFNGADTGLLFYLFESVFDNLHVTDVHVHEVLLDRLHRTRLEELCDQAYLAQMRPACRDGGRAQHEAKTLKVWARIRLKS